MLFKQFNLIYRYRKLVPKHTHLLLVYNGVKSFSTRVYKNKFDGPSLKDFIANDLPAQQTELLNDDEKIPYVDIVNLGQNRKGTQLNSFLSTKYKISIRNVHQT